MATDKEAGWTKESETRSMIYFDEPSARQQFTGTEGMLRYAGLLMACDWNIEKCVVDFSI